MKMNKLVYNASIILLASILLTACFKPKRYECLIDQEAKDYCLFEEGSYWIYQDSATLAIDSVVIDKPIKYDLIEQPGKEGNTTWVWEEYSIYVSSCSQSGKLFSRVNLTISTRYASKHLKLCMLMKAPGEYPYYHNGDIGEYFRSLLLSEKRDNYTLNGITHFDVKTFENDCFKEKKIIYWAKHVGLIRTEIYEKDSVIVKNLIKYNVKPYKK